MTNPNPAAQPVAWMYERNDGEHKFVEKNRWGVISSEGPLGYTETPLYAHPPEIAQPVAAVIMRAGKCGHHFNETCTSCVSALDYTNREMDSQRAEITRLQAEVERLREAVNEARAAADFIVGCFQAAEAEGIGERIRELEPDPDDPASISGIFARRINWAYHKAQELSAALR